MLKILKQGGTTYAEQHRSIVKPLEDAGLLICNYAGGYCKVTDKGIEAFDRFDTGAKSLDTILGYISKLGMEAIDKEYVILTGLNRLRGFGIFTRPFIPEKKTKNPFIEAFIRAGGTLLVS